VKVQLDLASDESVLETAESVIEQFLETLDWNEDEIYWFCLAIREVLINAIVHGNGRDPEKKVFLTVENNGEFVKATIIDEGKGSEIPKIPDALSPQNLLKPHGRGLYLAQQIVNKIQMTRTQSGGLEVQLFKTMTQGGSNENTHRRTG